MIRLFLFILVSLLLFQSCKSHPKTAAPASVSVVEDKTKTTGRVSHEFSSGGCGTVVIVSDPGGSKPPVVLIPNTPLAAFDVEGLMISFHYRPLKIRNPAGCTTGSPAALTDITKK